MRDKIVFDIETKNSFADVGGQDKVGDLLASVVGVYSYGEDRYYCFEEKDFGELAKIFQGAGLLISFSGRRFDVPVMEKYFNFKLAAIPHYDILEKIEEAYGRRVGLGVLAEANLGVGKNGQGLEAIGMYQRGEMEKLKEYCLQDVRITKGVFDLIRTQGYLWIPRRESPAMVKVPIAYAEAEEPQESLF